MAIVVELDLVDVLFETVDGSEAAISGARIELTGGATTNGDEPAPFNKIISNGASVDLNATDTATGTVVSTTVART